METLAPKKPNVVDNNRPGSKVIGNEHSSSQQQIKISNEPESRGPRGWRDVGLAVLNGLVGAIAGYLLGTANPGFWSGKTEGSVSEVGQAPSQSMPEWPLDHAATRVFLVDVKLGENRFSDPELVVTVRPPGPKFSELKYPDRSVQVFDTFKIEWNKGGSLSTILDTKEAGVGGGSALGSNREKTCLFRFDWITSNDLTDDNERTAEGQNKRKFVLLVRAVDFDSHSKCSF